MRGAGVRGAGVCGLEVGGVGTKGSRGGIASSSHATTSDIATLSRPPLRHLVGVWGLGIRVCGLGVWGLEFRVQGSGFRGLGIRD